LPAELRNKIYKCCLIVVDKHDPEYSTKIKSKGRYILVTKDINLPALLSVCHQVRNETLGIWYIENRFHIRIFGYDASLYLAWRRHLDALGPSFKAQKIPTQFKETQTGKKSRNGVLQYGQECEG
jgi:hypothetical protein